MQRIKCLVTALALLLFISMTAMAGETQGPNDPAPGEMTSPPGETQAPPGDGHTPGVMSILLGYWLGLD